MKYIKELKEYSKILSPSDVDILPITDNEKSKIELFFSKNEFPYKVHYLPLVGGGIEIVSNGFRIYKLEDNYYELEYYNEYYLCDQLSGLFKCIKTLSKKLYEDKSYEDFKIEDLERSELERKSVFMSENEYKIIYNLTKSYIHDLLYKYDDVYKSSTFVNHYNNLYYDIDILKLKDDYYLIKFYLSCSCINRLNHIKDILESKKFEGRSHFYKCDQIHFLF